MPTILLFLLSKEEASAVPCYRQGITPNGTFDWSYGRKWGDNVGRAVAILPVQHSSTGSHAMGGGRSGGLL